MSLERPVLGFIECVYINEIWTFEQRFCREGFFTSLRRQAMAFTQRVYLFEIWILKQGFWRGRCFMTLKSQGLPTLMIRLLAAIVLKPTFSHSSVTRQ